VQFVVRSCMVGGGQQTNHACVHLMHITLDLAM
jgi:hypothetical protein